MSGRVVLDQELRALQEDILRMGLMVNEEFKRIFAPD